jgi:hypothetical protein
MKSSGEVTLLTVLPSSKDLGIMDLLTLGGKYKIHFPKGVQYQKVFRYKQKKLRYPGFRQRLKIFIKTHYLV